MPKRRTTMSSTGSSSQSTLASTRSTFASSASVSSVKSIDSSELELHDLVAAFRANVSIKDRRYHLSIHRNVFIGSDAVRWMLKAGIANTRPDAVAIGLLMQEAGIIEHCSRGHEFKDDYLFYRFVSDHPRAALRAPPETRLLAPTRFLAPQETAAPAPRPHTAPRPSLDLSPHIHAPYPLLASLCTPADPHNADLLSQVRPGGWRAPAHPPTYDLVVVGGGTAGLSAALLAAEVGARVALVEARALGGAGLHAASVPLSALRRAANLYYTVNHARYLADRGLAVDAPAGAKLDVAQTLRSVRAARAAAAGARYADAEMLRDMGVHVYFGRGQFVTHTTLRVVDDDNNEYESERESSGSGASRYEDVRRSKAKAAARAYGGEKLLTFRKAVVATGSRAMLPLFNGVDSLLDGDTAATLQQRGRKQMRIGVKTGDQVAWAPVLTGATLCAQTTLPPRVGVIGCDAEALEVAQSLSRLGSSVTVFARSGCALRGEEVDAADTVAASLAREGVLLRLDVNHFVSVGRTGRVVGTDHEFGELELTTMEDGRERMYLVDALYAASARRPCTDGAALDVGGVRVSARGSGVLVSEQLQTANARVFAAGSCVGFGRAGGGGGHGESAMSAEMGRMAVRNALLLGKESAAALRAPAVTLTTPEVGRIGSTADELRRAGVRFRTLETRLQENDRAVCEGFACGARDGFGGSVASEWDATAHDGGGFFRVHIEEDGDKADGRILGATVVAHAPVADVLAEIVVATKQDVGLGSLGSVMRPYPTLGGLVGQTADVYNRLRVTGPIRCLMRGTLRAQR